MGGTYKTSVAEDRGALADPFPERRRAGEAGILHELRLVELLRVEADRTDQQLATAVRELLEQPRQRRAAVTGDRVGDAGQRQADGFLRQEHHDLLALLHGRPADEEGDRDPLGVLEPGREVDHDFPAISHRLLLSWSP